MGPEVPTPSSRREDFLCQAFFKYLPVREVYRPCRQGIQVTNWRLLLPMLQIPLVTFRPEEDFWPITSFLKISLTPSPMANGGKFMTLNELILKYPKLRCLKSSPAYNALSPEKQEYVVGLVEDALFWVELEDKPNALDGFKFLAATFGLHRAEEDAKSGGLQGKDREKFLRPHQDLYTMYNPYSGNGREAE